MFKYGKTTTSTGIIFIGNPKGEIGNIINNNKCGICVNITDYKRFSGEIEVAILNTLLEVLFRKLMGLKSEWVETFLANKLSLHFEGGTYGYLQMDKYRNKNEFYDYIKHGIVAVITETIEAKGTIRTFEKGFHVLLWMERCGCYFLCQNCFRIWSQHVLRGLT